MATKEEIELLRNMSVDDIKKYRPDLIVKSNKDDKQDSPSMAQDVDAASLKKRAGCGSYFIISSIVLVLLFIAIVVDSSIITSGRMYHYLFLWGIMSLLWFELPDGQLSNKGQFVVFVIIPYVEFIIVQLLGISNAFGLLFIIIYGAILCIVFKIDLNDGDSSYSSGKTAGKILGSAMKGTIKGMGSTSRRK